MRWSRYYLYTTREVPADAEVVSHRLMLRAGMIKKVAAGIYSYLPFGWRSFEKLMRIVRRELDRTGAMELVMPTIQPAELWEESKRWQKYGDELLRLKDRHDREFCYGPTAEETVTDIVRHDVRSYRQLPMNLYQIHTKFRDEIRPRFGLMRGREFLMKDAYSFHTDDVSLRTTYADMHDAYCRIFEACGLDYTVVEADTGAIGGSVSHEFMVVASTGESEVVRCPACDYAANLEKAEVGELEVPDGGEPAPMETVPTPGLKTVEEVSPFLGLPTSRMLKTLVYDNELDELVVVLMRGDREVNETKLQNHLDVQHPVLASDERVQDAMGAPPGSLGPVGLEGVRVIADPSVRDLVNFSCGANEAEKHHVNVNWGRDCTVEEWVDLVLARAGDPCPRCNDPDATEGEPDDAESTLELYRGIEVGHIFQLGDKYSEAMGCTFLDNEGQSHPMTMGCYGLGIGRTVAAAIEQNHDDNGIIWPRPLAPFELLLLALNPDDENVGKAAEELYETLQAEGLEVLYDDRSERPGVKFNDADLVGIPLRVVVGKRGLAEGQVEMSLRRDREKVMVPLEEVTMRIQELLAKA